MSTERVKTRSPRLARKIRPYFEKGQGEWSQWKVGHRLDFAVKLIHG